MNLEVLKDKICNHYLKDKNNECCGFVNDKDDIIEIENLSENKGNHFYMGMTIAQAKEKYGNIIAFYHSHAPGYNDFSEADKIISERINTPSIIYCSGIDELKIYYPEGIIIPYEGRPFQPYLFDCFALVKDYYHKELNIEISELIHEARETPLNLWDSKGFNRADNYTLINYFLSNGFTNIKDKRFYQKHDIILCRALNLKLACHCLISLGGNKILHQPNTSLSLKENLSNFWINRIVNIVRHNSLL